MPAPGALVELEGSIGRRDLCRLHDGAVARDVAVVLARGGLRRGLHGGGPGLRELRNHFRHRRDGVERRRQPRHDRGRRARRDVRAEEAAVGERRQAGLRGGRHLRQERIALRTREGERAQLARRDVRREAGRVHDHEVGVAAQEAGGGVRGAAVRHDGDVGAGGDLPELDAEPRAVGREVVLAGILAQQLDEFAERARGHLLRVHHHEVVVLAEHRDGPQLVAGSKRSLPYITGFTVAALELKRIV